jgi:TIR domain
MAKIFISYRHDDSQTVSDSIYTYLAEAFGSEAIWRDKEDIHPGANWERTIAAALRDTRVMVVIIGSTWVQELKNRLTDPEDWVRYEVRQALLDQIKIIPVFLPDADKTLQGLPSILDDLKSIQGQDVRNAPDFEDDMKRLIDSIKQYFSDVPEEATPQPEVRDKKPAWYINLNPTIIAALIGGGATIIAALIGLFAVIIPLINQNGTPQPTPIVQTVTETPTDTDTPTTIASDTPISTIRATDTPANTS